MKSLNTKIKAHDRKIKKAKIVVLAAPAVGLIIDYYGLDMWLVILFIEMICFMVLLHSTIRGKILQNIRGASTNE